MKKRVLLLSIILALVPVTSFSAPSNTMDISYSFSPQSTISSSETNSNNNEISTKYNAHTHTDITSVGTITTGTWQGTAVGTGYGGTGNAYGIGLPSGAIFFMLSGSCPSGSTDVTATYSDKFLRVNATPASTGGADSHTHAAGTFAGPSHQHTIAAGDDQTAGASGADQTVSKQEHTHDGNTGAEGTGSVTGTSASADNIPAYFTCIMCSVD